MTNKWVFSFVGMALTINQTHVMGAKAVSGRLHRPSDNGPLIDVHESTLEEFVHLTTVYHIPCGDEMQIIVLEEFTLPPMLREVLNTLCTHGVVRQHVDVASGA